MISDECCCGSKFKVSSNSGWAAGSEEKYAHQSWTDKHQVCRENKIVSLQQENLSLQKDQVLILKDRDFLLGKLATLVEIKINPEPLSEDEKLTAMELAQQGLPSDNGSDT